MQLWWIILIVIFFLGVVFIPLIISYKQKQKIKEKITNLAANVDKISPEEFFKIRNKTFGGQGSPMYARKFNFEGVYILLNQSKNMYYVGQGKRVLDRVNAHFTGKGNGDVYADYKYGDTFTIRMMSLEKSGFMSLNELERNSIMTYKARSKGYNKTRGNL